MTRTKVNVKLEAIDFDGPFDLLFALIEKKEYDIYDIPISELADQYIGYIDSVKLYDMDNMSEFLLMAATLLEIKSRMLIPRPSIEKSDEGEDPRDELVRRLIEYKRFKEITEVFREKEAEAALRVFRAADPRLREIYKSSVHTDAGAILNGVTLAGLYQVFEDAMNRREAMPGTEIEITPIDSEEFTIDAKIDFLDRMLIQEKRVRFINVFDRCKSKIEKVVTFLAILEMMRKFIIKVEQESEFDEIYIILNEDKK